MFQSIPRWRLISAHLGHAILSTIWNSRLAMDTTSTMATLVLSCTRAQVEIPEHQGAGVGSLRWGYLATRWSGRGLMAGEEPVTVVLIGDACEGPPEGLGCSRSREVSAGHHRLLLHLHLDELRSIGASFQVRKAHTPTRSPASAESPRHHGCCCCCCCGGT